MNRRSIFLVLFLCCFSLSQAQIQVKVMVKDSATNEPLTGATLLKKGSNEGTSTSASGSAKLAFPRVGNYPIVVSYVGYHTKIVNLNTASADSTILIRLSSNEQSLEEVTVSVSRTKSTIENIPTKIELIGQEDLNEESSIKPGNILSILGDIGGVQLQQASASTGNTFARIQGLNGRYTQILKDGLPMFGGLSSNLSIMQIPPLDLKQIEIIKGCGSTLYGGDAIGGIINLVTKNPGKLESTDVINFTTLNETNLNMYGGKKFQKMGYTFFFGNTRQFEKDIDGDQLSDVPKISSLVFHPKFVFYVSPKSTFTLNYTGTLDTRTGGNMAYFSSSQNSLYHVKNESYRNSLDAKWLYQISENENLTAKIANSYLINRLDTKYYLFDANQEIYYSELSYLRSFDRSEWVVGLNFNGDLFNKKTESFSAIGDYRYNTTGFFIQNTWHLLDKLTLESGFREDFHSQFGWYALPRLSAMYKLNPQMTLRINGGVGYKAPVVISYFEPETDLNKLAIPQKLNSELSQGVNADFNFQHHFGNNVSLIVNQSLFYTNITHPIVDIAPDRSTVTLINAEKPIQTLGFQTYSRLSYDDVEFYLGYVYTNVKLTYDPSHPRPIATPMQNLSTTLMYECSEKFRMGIEASLVADQLDQNFQKTKNYVLCALMCQYNFGHFSLVLNGENLLDFRQSRYERIFDGSIDNPQFHQLWAPIDGRVINLSLKYSLSGK